MWKCSPLCEMTMKDDLLLDDVCAWCPVQACFVDCMWLAGNTDGLTEYHPALLVDYACSPAVWTPPPFSSSPSASYAHYTSAPEPPLLWPAIPLPRNPHFCDPLHLCPGTPTSVTCYTSAPEPPLSWPATPLPWNPHFCEKLKQQKWKAWERKERTTCQRLIANTAWTLTVVWPPTKVHFVAHFFLMDFGVWTPCPFVVHFLLMDFGGWTLSPGFKVYLAPFLYCACVLGCFVNVWWMTSNFLSDILDLSSVQTGVMFLLVHVQ